MDIEKAKAHLAEIITENGGLEDPVNYLSYTPGAGSASLDGEFTAEDLEAIAIFMRASQAA